MLGQLITVDINAWANQVHGCTNSRATVSLPPAHLAVKGTSATGQCCQRPEPLPPLDKREDRGCTPGIGPGERVRRTMPVPELEPTKRNQGRPVRWGPVGSGWVCNAHQLAAAAALSKAHTGGCAGSPPSPAVQALPASRKTASCGSSEFL